MKRSRKTIRRIGLPLLALALVAFREGLPSFPEKREIRKRPAERILRENGSRPRKNARTAVIEFRLGERKSCALIRTAGKSWGAVLPSRDVIERSVNGFIRAVGHAADNAEAVGRAARRIAGEILPFEPELARLGVNRLVFIPDGVLRRLAFEALRPDGAASPDWLIEKYAVSYAFGPGPGGKSLIKPEAGGRRLLALGAPGIRPAPFRARRGPGRGFLPSVRREIRAVSRFFSGDFRHVYFGGEATEDNFRKHRGGCYQVVHIAAHGRRGLRPKAPARLFLSSAEAGGEELRPEAIRGCGLSAELVVLSACESAAGPLLTGGGFGGLPGAFLREGARSVTATLWPVPDRTTADFMVCFYRRMKSGLDKSAALRSAKRRMIRRGRPHPFYWAGYVLFGDPDGTIAFP